MFRRSSAKEVLTWNLSKEDRVCWELIDQFEDLYGDYFGEEMELITSSAECGEPDHSLNGIISELVFEGLDLPDSFFEKLDIQFAPDYRIFSSSRTEDVATLKRIHEEKKAVPGYKEPGTS